MLNVCKYQNANNKNTYLKDDCELNVENKFVARHSQTNESGLTGTKCTSFSDRE